MKTLFYFKCIFVSTLLITAPCVYAFDAEASLLQKQKQAFLLQQEQFSKSNPTPQAAVKQQASSATLTTNLRFQKQLSYLSTIKTNHWNSNPSPVPTEVPLDPSEPPLVVDNKFNLSIPNHAIGKIEVSIGDQKCYVYDTDGNLLFTSLIVSGKSGWGTPRGNWRIISKRRSFYMVGNIRGQHWRVWTNYAAFFTGGGHALHDAPWRKKFGWNTNYRWNGSHGCVNMPLPAARYIYENAPYNTPVRVY